MLNWGVSCFEYGFCNFVSSCTVGFTMQNKSVAILFTSRGCDILDRVLCYIKVVCW